MTASIEPVYKPWLIASVVVLVGSLALLAVAVTAALLPYGDAPTPLWVQVLGAVAVLGIAAGFGGLVLLLVTAGWRSFRE